MSEVTSSQNVNSSNNVTGGGVDYGSGPYIVTFPAGVTSVPFYVPVNNDNILEDDEDFILTIMRGSLPDGVNRGDTDRSTLIIVDNDCKPNVYITLCGPLVINLSMNSTKVF